MKLSRASWECVRRVLFHVTVIAWVIALCMMFNNVDLDVWHRLASGHVVLSTGSAPMQDPFGYTERHALWVDHEWGMGVVDYLLTAVFGDLGLWGLKIGLVTAVLYMIRRVHRILYRGWSPAALILTLLSFWSFFPGFMMTLRAHAFTYFFFTLWLLLLERLKRGEKGFAWLFPVTAIPWVNIHGGFLAGIGLIGLYMTTEFLLWIHAAWRASATATHRRNLTRMGLILAFVLAASLINPYGPLMWVYLLRAVTMERPYIVEWWSPRIADFGQLWSGFPFMLGITIIGVAYALISRRRAIFRQGWLLLAVTCYLGLRHMRHLTFFGLTAAVFSLYPFLLAIKSGYHAAYRRLKITIRPALTQAAAFVADMAVYPAALAVAGYLIATSNLQVKVDPYAYPVWAIEFIRTNRIAGNLLLPFNWSSYALWKLHPQCRVSLDGRYESVYTEQAAEDVDEFMYGFSNWTVMLEKYSNNAIMVFVHGESYSNMLTRADWTNIYNDYLAGLFVPTSAAPAGFIWTPPGSNHDFSAEKYISSMGGP